MGCARLSERLLGHEHMADVEEIRSRIREIAKRRKNVVFSDIEWVVKQLGEFLSVSSRKAKHGTLFRVGDQRFMVNSHNPGSKQIKPYSVDDFIQALTELGWYEE